MKLKTFLVAAMAAMVSLSGHAQLTDGTVYWIQDVSTGQFLSQGDSWATKAVAQDVGGLGFEAVYVSDGVYKLNNIMWNTVKSATVGLGIDVYVDQAPAEWTIEAKDGGYTIKNGSNYLVNNGAENTYKEKPIGKTTDAAAATVWKFLTKTEYDAAVQAYQDSKAASYATTLGYDANSVAALEALIADEENQFITKDYTTSINNPTLGSNDTGWTHGRLGNRGNEAGGWAVGSGCAEFWNGCGYATQTVSNLPNGLYKVTFVGSYRPANKNEALTLASEKASSPAFVYANDAKVEFLHWIDVANQANGRDGITVANGYQNSFYTYVTNGTLALGVVADGWTDGYSWCTFGQFTLTQIYSVASYKKAYDDAMTAATAAQTSLTGFDVYASKKSTLDAAITENTLTGDDLADVDKLQAAAESLSAAAAAVAAEKAVCEQYATIVSTIGEGTNVNLTSFVANASFEAGNLSNWTSTDGGGVANNNNFSYKVGTYYVERWSWAGQSQVTLSDGTLVHDDIVLPAGVYLLSANGQVQEQYNGTTGGGYYLYGNDEKVEMGVPGTYSTYVKLSDKEKLVIKIALEGCTGNWISCDNVQLTYVGADFPAYTLVTGKMNATTASAQTEAETAFTGAQTAANYNALLAAINVAQASKDAYAKTAPAIEDAKTLGTNFNFATAAATTTFNEAVTAVETAYNNGTLSNVSAANAGNLGTVLVGWHAARASENFTIAEAYMQSAWTGGELNDWSTEGDSDGSDFHIPFFQNWTGDANSLAEGTTSGQLTGLANGLYRVSALVRVRIKNDQEAEATPTGITLQVNDGDAVDACTGDQIGETQFYLGTITAEGLVKDGILNAVFNKAAENNVSWLCFKDITYTKVRDLTEEEMATAPTAIAIYKGEDEVTEAIELDAENTSVTLTTVLTPAEASEGYIDWTSSDVSVATVSSLGEVTAVLPGTATITAKSTLNGEVSTSVTVNVTFPETEVVSDSYVDNGATRTVVTLGENLIKNGAFEYPNSFYGWTTGSGAAMSSDNFNLVTEDDNHYIKAKGHTGAGGVNSVGTGWTIEAGKTYVFGYKVKSTSAGNSEYHVVSLTNTLGTETQKVSKTETAVGTDWTDVSYTFTNPEENGYAYVQFRARWLNSAVSFDDFYLQEVTSENIIGNVQYALDAIPTANIGEGAFQYSQDAIDAANALVQGTATVEDVENAYAALTTLNAPEVDQAFNIVMGELTWTNNNNATMLSTVGKAVTYYANDRADGGFYNARFDKAPNTNLAQAFYFTAAEGVNKYTIYQIDTDGAKRYLCTGTVYGGNANQVRTTTEAASAEVYTITATAAEGVYNFTNSSSINLGAQDAGLYGTTRNNNLLIVETAKPSITINTTAAGWGSVMLPFAAEIPEGVKAYSVSETSGNVLNLVKAETLEANKPYILEGEVETVLTGDAQGTALTYTNGLLTGVYAATPAPVDSYVLQKNNDVVGFYLVADGEQPTVGANRAYLTVPAAGVKAFFFDSTATAIQNVMSGAAAGEIYDLAGRKVSKMQRGNTYIVNGQKVMIK